MDIAEIPKLEEKDEQSLEVQEVNLENEAFERQGKVVYNGSDKAPNISVGECQWGRSFLTTKKIKIYKKFRQSFKNNII